MKYIYEIHYLPDTLRRLEISLVCTSSRLKNSEIDNIQQDNFRGHTGSHWQTVNYNPFVSGRHNSRAWWWLCQCGGCQGCPVEYLDYNMCIIAAAVMTCHWANYKIMDHRHLISRARNSGYLCRICAAAGRQKLDRYIRHLHACLCGFYTLWSL